MPDLRRYTKAASLVESSVGAGGCQSEEDESGGPQQTSIKIIRRMTFRDISVLALLVIFAKSTT
jgi:hypothetical protein